MRRIINSQRLLAGKHCIRTDGKLFMIISPHGLCTRHFRNSPLRQQSRQKKRAKKPKGKETRWSEPCKSMKQSRTGSRLAIGPSDHFVASRPRGVGDYPRRACSSTLGPTSGVIDIEGLQVLVSLQVGIVGEESRLTLLVVYCI